MTAASVDAAADEPMEQEAADSDVHMASASQPNPAAPAPAMEEGTGLDHPLDVDELRNLEWWDSAPGDVFKEMVSSLPEVPGQLALGVSQAREAVAERILQAGARQEQLRT